MGVAASLEVMSGERAGNRHAVSAVRLFKYGMRVAPNNQIKIRVLRCQFLIAFR